MDSPAHAMTSPTSPGNLLHRNRGSFTSHMGRGTSPFTAPPLATDLDRPLARDLAHVGPLSISGNYKDASGRVIKRYVFTCVKKVAVSQSGTS